MIFLRGMGGFHAVAFEPTAHPGPGVGFGGDFVFELGQVEVIGEQAYHWSGASAELDEFVAVEERFGLDRFVAEFFNLLGELPEGVVGLAGCVEPGAAEFQEVGKAG